MGIRTTDCHVASSASFLSWNADWTRVVDLVQAEFREGKLVEESTWQAVVLIPKGKKDYRGIGLVGVM